MKNEPSMRILCSRLKGGSCGAEACVTLLTFFQYPENLFGAGVGVGMVLDPARNLEGFCTVAEVCITGAVAVAEGVESGGFSSNAPEAIAALM